MKRKAISTRLKVPNRVQRAFAGLLFVSFIALSATIFFHHHHKDGMKPETCTTSAILAAACPREGMAAFNFHKRVMQSLFMTLPRNGGFLFAFILAAAFGASFFFKRIWFDPLLVLKRILDDVFRESRRKRNPAIALFPNILRTLEWRSLHALLAPARA
ncbi:hypothetical protein HYV58_02060 [Candidatus Peregrinibacteria bacterium]|nr:hypothetical protein [Candidatus Peregrinibacteria bacterium]